MDSVGDFEDDYFEECRDGPSIKSAVNAEVQSYIPKQCPPQWYNTPNNTPYTNDELFTVLKFQADCFYRKGEYSLAIDRYEQVLPLLPKTNVTFQRDCLEGIARSWLKIGPPHNGLEWVKKLEGISKTTNQFCVAWSILCRIHHADGKYNDEIATLHQLLFHHPLSVPFWIQLVNAYAAHHAIPLPRMEASDCRNDRNYDVAACSRLGANQKNSSEAVEVARCEIGAGEIVNNCQADKPESCCGETAVTYSYKGSDIVNHCVENYCFKHTNSLCLTDQICRLNVSKRRDILIIAACLVRLSIVIQATENNEQFVSYKEMQRLLQNVEKQLHEMNLTPAFHSVAKEMLGKDVGWCHDSDRVEFEDLSKLVKEQGEEVDTPENSSRQFEKQWFSWVDQFLIDTVQVHL